MEVREFKVGDRVMYFGSYREYHGKVFEIVHKSVKSRYDISSFDGVHLFSCRHQSIRHLTPLDELL